MNIFLYSGSNSARAQQKLAELRNMIRGGEHIRLLPSLEPEPDIPLRIGDIVILVADSGHELDLMVARREALADYRLIVIPPDNSPETVSKVHLLRPRFFDMTGDGWFSINEVIRRIITASGHVVLQRTMPIYENDRNIPEVQR